MQHARFFALIPCAGAGARAGAALPKQYRTVAGHSLLYYTLAAFDACAELTQTLIVLANDDAYFDPRHFPPLRFIARRCGGASRQESVLNGLHALSEYGARDNDWTLVHDAARPGVTSALIRKLIETVSADPVGGLIALPLTDTLKRAAPSRPGAPVAAPRSARTEPRAGLWLAQTPQMFRLGLLRDALLRAQREKRVFTDEAGALEWLGYAPRLVAGNLSNFKVTYAEDFELAEAVLSRKKR